ncbi:hypothetical protein HispidOSU_007833 [Sigmodon hispidus]
MGEGSYLTVIQPDLRPEIEARSLGPWTVLGPPLQPPPKPGIAHSRRKSR